MRDTPTEENESGSSNNFSLIKQIQGISAETSMNSLNGG